MDPTALSPNTAAYAERLARLCVPVRLSSDVLPRFVLIMLERSLHSIMCSVAACLVELHRRYEAGILEAWPEATDNEALEPQPRRSRYRMKSAPVAASRSAGAQHVQILPEALALSAAGVDAADALGEAGLGVAVLHPAWPRSSADRGLRPALRRLPVGGLGPPADRCRTAIIFSAAEMRRDNCA